jgi:glycosidase
VKNIFPWIVLLSALYACSTNSVSVVSSANPFPTRTPGQIPSSVTSGNYNSWPVSLAPYEFKLIRIHGAGEPIDTTNGWWKDAVVYQVWVRSYLDSDSDGIGDLPGLASMLDYVTNLGFGAIWTQPIFSSPSTHGYDVTDYYSINSAYGGFSGWSTYLAAAKARGIRVVLDMVVNDTSSAHPWFLASSSNTAYQDWYVWSATSPTGWDLPWDAPGQVWYYSAARNAYYYAAFSSDMPDLNLTNPSVVTEMTNIATYWISQGADGFRLDGARYLIETGPGTGERDTPQTIAFWENYRNAVKAADSNFLTVGEVWTADPTVSTYFDQGKGLDECFDFDLQNSIIQSVTTGSSQNILSTLNSRKAPNTFFGVFLDNHDEPQGDQRLMDCLSGNFDLAKICAAIALTLPGTPYIYYGTEIGMMKGPQSGDTCKRTPMQWTSGAGAGFTTGTPWAAIGNNSNPFNVAAQATNGQSLLSYYKALLTIRNSYEGLRRGDFHILSTGNNAVLAYLRPGTNDTILFLANLNQNPQKVNLDFSSSQLPQGATLPVTELLSGASNSLYR